MSVLKERYDEDIISTLMNEFEYDNIMEAPEVEKIVVNMGIGDAGEDADLLDQAVESLRTITGQDPVITRAKKSVANFKIRQGMPIGCKVTLREASMYEFLYKLSNVALPRVRDFRGLSANSFDGHGNYSLGIDDYTVFPELSVESIELILGMDITIVTSAETDEEAKRLLSLLGMPFRN